MRTLTPEMDRALRSRVVRPVLLIDFQHPVKRLRIWTGIGVLQYLGESWTGAGNVIQISPVERTTEIEVQRISVSFVPLQLSDDIKNLVLTPVSRVPFSIDWALIDDRSQVIPDPIPRFRGYANAPGIAEGDGEDDPQAIQMAVEGEIYNVSKPSGTQMDNEEQALRFPGDTGFSQMASIADRQDVWSPGPYNNFAPPAP